MDLRTVLLRIATARPHTLIVGGAGTDRLRARVEHELGRRRWPVATAPADADVVVVLGSPGAELASVVEDVWAGVPAPRTRLRVVREDDVVAELDGAVEMLGDLAVQRARAPENAAAPPDRSDDSGHGESGHDESGHDEHEHEHDGGHHHHGGGMELPGGLAMADLGDDRDGLALDRLHVALGPVLPEWPSGLVVEVTLQGDVIQQARSRFLDDDGRPAADTMPEAARELATTARVLALAGWAGPAARARDLRDTVLFGDGGDTARVLGELDALHRRVRRSRLLRWMLRGSGAGRSELVEALDDTLRSARAALTGAGAAPAAGGDLAALDARLVGAELAAARLIVAAADPRPQRVLTPPADREGPS